MRKHRAFWGVLAVQSLAALSLAQPILINEIHYNPLGSSDLEEFIELHNPGSATVELGGWNLGGFATPGCTFPPGTTLAPAAYLVAAKSPAALLTATGYSTPFTWGADDSLSNGGELIELRDDSGDLVDAVTYDDAPPWPTPPDGGGPSLELVNPLLDNAVASAWLPSGTLHGSPGAPNTVFSDAPLVVAEIPPRLTAVPTLASVTVEFSTPVTGVSPADLLVAGSPATAVIPPAGPADTYTFSGFSAPPAGSVEFELLPGAIVDSVGLPFGGDAWTASVGITLVINEVHYHPPDSEPLAEFLEIYNAGTATADLAGGGMTDGVDLTFAAGTLLAPGGYLVLAADPALLAAVTGYEGATAWTSGRLDNSGENLILSDAAGNVLDQLQYADGGSWPPAADGDGPSLELVNPALPNEFGGAWAAASLAHGTPGALNSRYDAAPPPIIRATTHEPPIPAGGQSVKITTFVIDDGPTPTVTLVYRQDQDPTVSYVSVSMFDDGAHDDGAAGDHVYGVTVPGLPAGERLDFAIRASDGVSETAAPPGHDTLVAGEYPTQTFLCKFQDPPYFSTAYPTYHLVTTQHTRNLQTVHNESEYDATFIHCNTAGQCQIFYNIIEHYRGANSLNLHPHSFHLRLNDDQPLNSELGFPITRILLNSQSIVKQRLGMQLFAESFGAALPMPRTQFVRLNTSPLSHGGVQDYIYINVERLDGDFLTSQGGQVAPPRFPDLCTGTAEPCGDDFDCPPGETCAAVDDGNLYRGRHNDAHLRWEGWDPAAYMVDASGQNGYELENNEDDHDWTDLLTLCYALDAGTTPDATYEEAVRAQADELEWARWFALHMLLVNREGGIYRDTGDDYYIWFRPTGAPGGYHATLLAWDLDSTYGGFGTTFLQETIWRTAVPSPKRFLRSNAFAGTFVDALADLLDVEFQQAAMDARIDAIPDEIFAQERTYLYGGDPNFTKQRFKQWVSDRRAYVNGELKRDVTLLGVPGGTYTNPDPVLPLNGQLDQRSTHALAVNGRIADAYSVYAANWSHALTLHRGMNPIVVQCLDAQGQETNRAAAAVRYDPPPAAIRVTAPRRMLDTKTLTLKAELLDADGAIDWRVWNALGSVSARRVSSGAGVPTSITIFETYPAGPGQSSPADSIRFYNGVGTVSFTLDNGTTEPAGELEVTVTLGGVSASARVTVLDADRADTFQQLSGELSGDDLVWEPADGVIHLTGHVTVPPGATLVIRPGTLVMVDAGVAGDGTKIVADNASIAALGTREQPISFFATSGPAAMVLPQTVKNNPPSWGGFHLQGAGATVLTNVFLTGAGNNPIAGHPRPPVIHLAGAHALQLAECVFADSPGKLVHGGGSGDYLIQGCTFTRTGIGGEFVGSGYQLVVEDSWFARIGRSEVEFDCVGYILHVDHPADAVVRRCILTDGGDDLIDHSTGATPMLEHCILYDADDKAVSMDGSGTLTCTNCLLFNTPAGLRCAGAPVFLTHCTFGPSTLLQNPDCAASEIDRCIFWPVHADTCCGSVQHTLVGFPEDLGCGTGNFSSDPLFADAPNGDFTLHPDSPALAAGPTSGRIGWLGFPTAEACALDGQCDDGNDCTADLCELGACVHLATVGCCQDDSDCEDAVACTIDLCNQSLNACEFVPSDAACDDGAFCNGAELCDPDAGCVDTAPPCSGDEWCDEIDDACVGAPLTEAAGPRYLEVTPTDGLSGVAIAVDSEELPCLPRYVNAQGRLVDVPVYRPSSQWGTVRISDRELVPGVTYEVRVLSGAGTSAPAAVQLPPWGDTTRDGVVDESDILCVLDGFRADFATCGLAAVDLAGFTPDRRIDLYDIVAALDASLGLPYPDASPCGATGVPGARGGVVELQLVPRRAVVRVGEVLELDAFVSAAVDLRGYQLRLAVVSPDDFASVHPTLHTRAQAGPPGAGPGVGHIGSPKDPGLPLTLVDAYIDEARPDYVFVALTSYGVGDPAGERLAGAAVTGIDVSEWQYVGTFEVRALAGGSEPFTVGVRAGDSLLLDSLGLPHSFVQEEAAFFVLPESERD